MAMDGGGFSAACRRALAVLARHPSQFFCSEIIVGGVSLITYAIVVLLAFDLSVRTSGSELTYRNLFGLGEQVWEVAGLSHDLPSDGVTDKSGSGTSAASTAAQGDGQAASFSEADGWEAEEVTAKDDVSVPERKMKEAAAGPE